MARQFKSDDTSAWLDKYGTGSSGPLNITSDTTDSARSGFSNTTFAGTSTQSTGTAGAVGNFIAGDLILIYQTRDGGSGAGAWELNKISSTGTGTNWTLSYPLQNTYATTGQVYRLLQYSSITIDSGKTLTGVAWGGTTGGVVALLCNGTTTITGNITANGKGYRGATSQQEISPPMDGTNYGFYGENIGNAGAFYNQNGAYYNGGGGGGGDYSPGGGGGGGHRTSGGNGTSSQAGVGGSTAGSDNLVTMIMGGGGGAGASWSGTTTGGDGGNGGGVVFIISKNVTIAGTINTGATVGTAGTGPGSPDTRVGSSGAGGGAGGSTLIKCQNAILGDNLISSAGASGGGHTNYAGDGGTGGSGAIHTYYSKTISGKVFLVDLPSANYATKDPILDDSGFMAMF